YIKANCEWRTRKQQNNNRRNNRIIVVCDIPMSLGEFCEKYKISNSTARYRLNGRDALTEQELSQVLNFVPAFKAQKLYEIGDQSNTLAGWSAQCGVEPGTILK